MESVQPKIDGGTIKLLIYLAIGIVIFMLLKKFTGVFSGLGEAFGMKDTKEESATKNEIENTTDKEQSKGNKSFWSPNWYKTVAAQKAKAKIITMAGAKTLCKQIYDSVGYTVDTPSQGLAAFKNCKTKSQISFLSDQFNKIYKKDLLSWLKEKYDTNEQKQTMSDILNYCDSLPMYNI